jgi:hypothetical protein
MRSAPNAAFERRGRHADEHPAARETFQDVACREGIGDRVELVPAFDKSGGGRRVEVGTQRDHQDVRVERAGVGGGVS